MKPAGLREFEAARRTGAWTTPMSPRAEPRSHPTSRRRSTPTRRCRVLRHAQGNNRYAFLYRLHHVKKPEARAKRISMYIEMLGDRKTFH